MPSTPTPLCRDCTRRSINNTPYCAEHQTDNNAAAYAKAYDEYRADDRMKALRNKARWQATRRTVFLRDPLCKMCGHRASTECDHVIPARQIVAEFGEDAFYDPARCQGLCRGCHSQKTATEDSAFARKKYKT